MKKLLCFVLAITMSCQMITKGFGGAIKRCENDEVICYTKTSKHSSLFCKFKG